MSSDNGHRLSRLDIVQACPVSVVIPCYCCAATIDRAMNSVAAQTCCPAEVIMVDDGNGKDIVHKLHTLQERYEKGWVRIIELPTNIGAASARNAGWAMATQPYIAFLDADDSWHPEKLRIQYDYMRNNPDVALCGHQCVWLRDSQLMPELPHTPNMTKINANRLLFKNGFSTPTVMLRRDIPFRFQDGKRCAEDLLLWQQIAFAGLQVVRIESPLAYIHKPVYGAGGLSAQLWKMEGGELSNFNVLYRTKNINFLMYAAATSFSMTKFIKRLFVTTLKSLARLSLHSGDVA